MLVLTSSFPRTRDSHEARWILELTQSLTELGIQLHVLAPHFPGGKIHESWDQVRISRFIYFFPTRFERVAYGQGLLFNIQKDIFALIGLFPFLISGFLHTLFLYYREQIALIHTHWLIPQGFIGAVFHRIWKVPHVTTIHGTDLNIITHYKILAPIGRFIIRNSSSVTVNSTYMKNQLVSFFPEITKQITVIPMGINPDKYRSGTFSDFKKEFQSGHIILCVGRLIDWKGTIYLINAMPEVIRNIPDALLLIAGAGPEKNVLIQRANELGLGKKIKFLGLVSNEVLTSLYQSADVFVLPSINKNGKTEALGVVLLEAMASMCPVIGSNVGGIPDIIIDGENGFLVPEQRSDILSEKIVQLLADLVLAKQFRKAGFETVQRRFSWEVITRQFSVIFSQTIDKSF